MNKKINRSTRFLSAAIRHISDAEHLATPGQPHTSLDQAEHLAGFAPECARKALLDLSHLPNEVAAAFDKLLGHDFGDLAEQAIGLALALSPAARHYNVVGWGTNFPELLQWKEDCRYQYTGLAEERQRQEQAKQQPLWIRQQLLQTARKLVDDAAIALWIDGRLDSRYL